MKNNDVVPGFDQRADDPLRIVLQRVDRVPGCLVLYLDGYQDTYNSNYFQMRVAKAIEAGFTNLIFDISGTQCVSSVEIGNYVAFLRAVRPRGGDLVLINMPPSTCEVYRLLGFSNFFNIKANLDEAIAFFVDRSPSSEERSATQFARILKCPECGKKLRATRPGRFRCSECKTILSIDGTGRVSFG